MSKTVLILGGYGLAGQSLARFLLAESDAHIVLAGRSMEKSEQAAAALNQRHAGQRVSARRADAADAASLAQALQGVDLLLVATSATELTRQVMQAALAAGVDYLDIQYAPGRFPTLQPMASQIERAGLCFVSEAGLHPGTPAALIRHVAASLDQVEQALCGMAFYMKGGFPYSSGVDDLMRQFADYKAEIYDGGAWRKADMITMKDNKTIDFGPPFRRKSCVPLTLDELHDLPAAWPTLRRLGCYVAGFNWFVDWLLTPLIMVAVRLWPQRAVRPMGRLFSWATRVFASPPYGVAVVAEASGQKDGAAQTARVVVGHADGYDLTAIPVVAYLLQYLDGSARRPGLHVMGRLVEPQRFVRDMQRMGAQITEETRRAA